MRRTRVLAALLLALLLTAAICFQTAAAGYTYTVRLYAGSRGTIGGQEVVVYENLRYGDRLTFRMEDVELEPDSKYYVRGFRESGRDNDTVGVPSFVVTKDQDYVVAYGVRGEVVAYTVRYLDTNGNPLLDDETFYGNVGDKPVIAFRYIDGYQPRYYNVTRTLSDNAADNLFEFYYDRAQSGAGNPGGEGGQTGPGGEGGEGGEGSQTPGELIDGGERPGEGGDAGQPEEIYDYDTPLAPPAIERETKAGNEALLLTGIGLLIVGAILVLIILPIRLRKLKKDEDE